MLSQIIETNMLGIQVTKKKTFVFLDFRKRNFFCWVTDIYFDGRHIVRFTRRNQPDLGQRLRSMLANQEATDFTLDLKGLG